MAGFARYPHLTTLDRIQVGRALLAARGDRSPKGDMAAWLRRHHQSARALRAFWDPFLVPALNAPLDRVSAEMGLFVIRTAFLGDRDAARIAYLHVPLAQARGGRGSAVRRRPLAPGRGRPASRGQPRHRREAEWRHGRGVRRLRHRGAAEPSQLDPRGRSRRWASRASMRSQPMPIVDVHLWYDRPGAGLRLRGAARFTRAVGVREVAGIRLLQHERG